MYKHLLILLVIVFSSTQSIFGQIIPPTDTTIIIGKFVSSIEEREGFHIVKFKVHKILQNLKPSEKFHSISTSDTIKVACYLSSIDQIPTYMVKLTLLKYIRSSKRVNYFCFPKYKLSKGLEKFVK